jgi:hypothetical protein
MSTRAFTSSLSLSLSLSFSLFLSLSFSLSLSVYQEQSDSLYCAGNFYKLKRKCFLTEEPPPIAYVLMIGFQPKHSRSPLLPHATVAIVKWHTPPSGLLGES